jgi:hypothetical protein
MDMLFIPVMLNLFQHPSIIRIAAPVARWTLKQVQGDEAGLKMRSVHS